MTGAGIFPNDILVVDRSIEPVSGKVVNWITNYCFGKSIFF
jgi:hypothetical protein